MKQEAEWFDRIIGAREAAAYLGVTPVRVRQLVGEGWIAQPPRRNRYSLRDVLRGYLKFLDDSGRRANKSAAANRVADARTAEIMQRVTARNAELMRSDDLVMALRETFAIMQAEFVGLHARFTRDLVARKRLETEIDGILQRCGDKVDEFADGLPMSRFDNPDAKAQGRPPPQNRASRRLGNRASK